MSSLGEMFVEIGADMTSFERSMKQMQSAFSGVAKDFENVAGGASGAFNNLGQEVSKVGSKFKTSIGPAEQELRSLQQAAMGSTREFSNMRRELQASMQLAVLQGKEVDSALMKQISDLQWAQRESQMLLQYSMRFGPETAKSIVESMKPMQELSLKQREIQSNFVKMTFNRGQFEGDATAYIAKIQEMGAAQKKIKDEMMKADQMGLVGINQTVATMLNMTTQSQRIGEAVTQIGSRLGQLAAPTLVVSKHFEELAHQGNAAVLALKQLGPTANMKQLNDRMMMIQQGTMRAGAVALIAAAGFYGLSSAIMNGLQSQGLTRFSDAIDSIKDHFNTFIGPFLQSFDQVFGVIAEAVDKVMAWAAAWAQANPTLAAAVGWFGFLVSALLLLLAPLAVGIGMIGGLAASFSAAWVAIGPLIVGLGAVLGPALLVAAAVVAIGTALVLAWQNSETFRSIVLGAWDAVKTGTLAMWTAMKAGWDLVIEIFTKAPDFFKGIGDSIEKAWGDLKDGTVKIWEDIKNFVVDAFKWLYDHNYYFKDLVDFVVNMWQELKSVTSEVWQSISNFLEQVWSGIKSAVSELANDAENVLSQAWNNIEWAVSNAWGSISGTISNIAGDIGNELSSLADDAYNWGSNMISMFEDGISSRISAITNRVRQVADTVASYLGFHSPTEKGPLSDSDEYMPNMMSMYGDGIVKGIPKLQNIMGSVAGVLQPDVNVSAGGTAAASPIYDFEKLFEGAIINVRTDNDIKNIGRELFNLTVGTNRAKGVK